MTHQEECTVLDDLTNLLIEHGPSAMASALATLMNHAMQIEREQTLQAESHQRTDDRQGYANGFKPKTIRTRVGEVVLRIPQTRGYHVIRRVKSGHASAPQNRPPCGGYWTKESSCSDLGASGGGQFVMTCPP